jgi:hypothetical protein
VPISDTSPAAQALQDEIHRAMTGEQRVLLAFEMSLFARELARAGIEREHPDWPADRVTRELLKLAFLPNPLPAGLR